MSISQETPIAKAANPPNIVYFKAGWYNSIQSIITKCEENYDRTGDLAALKFALDGYIIRREIMEVAYADGYGPPPPAASTFTPEQAAQCFKISIDRLRHIIDVCLKHHEKTGDLEALKLADETRANLQKMIRQAHELSSYGLS